MSLGNGQLAAPPNMPGSAARTKADVGPLSEVLMRLVAVAERITRHAENAETVRDALLGASPREITGGASANQVAPSHVDALRLLANTLEQADGRFMNVFAALRAS